MSCSSTGHWRFDKAMTILDRYLLRELAGAWLIGLAVFVGFLLVGEVLRKSIELFFSLKAPLSEVLRWVLLALPYLVAWSIPISTLFSVVMTIGRMSHDLEITALLAAGVSFLRLLVPIGGLALLISFLSFWLNAFVVPPTYGAADALLWRYRERGGATTGIFIADPPKAPRLILNASQFDPAKGEMRNLWLIETTEKGERVYLEARKARWVGNQWEFYNGFVQVITPDKPMVREQFERLSRPTVLRPPTELSTDKKRLTPNRLTLLALSAEIKRMRQWNVPYEVIAEYIVEWHNRFAMSLSCFVLAMLGAPIALKLRRGGGIAVGVSVVLFLLYYLVWNIGCQLSEAGQLPALIGSHLPNLIGLAFVAAILSRLK
ncbi:LptF/LptG family permease [Fervidibacter sacchari]|uniref:Lipopolysaccharide export system permease protein n=1 Tax=Candidatus Fervidibacter sacchari TaxID=1448929 RepID=A0ABT2ESE9_9BACT|nr:LptF/LptG family permease [Candidatus Fervidibacter sacchari]MCS3920881.1 lipopolysaccharide export system permease protein [Candidatus Fervidibacter sacchari]WKU17791.1 LptF/LptG family permease [Candidatus Fervidibacter sacchari]